MYMLVCACISFTVDDIFLWMTNKIHAYTETFLRFGKIFL